MAGGIARLICAGAGRPASFAPMALSFLEFEQPIAELEAKIDELRYVSSDAEVNVGSDAPAIDRLLGFAGRDPAWVPASH